MRTRAAAAALRAPPRAPPLRRCCAASRAAASSAAPDAALPPPLATAAPAAAKAAPKPWRGRTNLDFSALPPGALAPDVLLLDGTYFACSVRRGCACARALAAAAWLRLCR
jgi:hypothetical protein